MVLKIARHRRARPVRPAGSPAQPRRAPRRPPRRRRPARRARRGADPGHVRLWRLADVELRRRRDARSRAATSPAGCCSASPASSCSTPRSPSPASTRSGRPALAETRTPATAVMRLALGETGADPDRARHRHLGARLPQPGHADHAARLFRDGRGRAVLPQRRRGQRDDARAGRRDPAAGRGGDARSRCPARYGQILSYVVSVDFIWFGLTGAALFVFRRRDRGARRLPRRPAIPFTTGLFVAACAADRRGDGLQRTRSTARSALRSCSPAFRPASTGSASGARMSAARMQSEYMHWAKTQPPVALQSRLERSAAFPRSTASRSTIADLELDGASRYRYPPLREAIAAQMRRRRPTGW